MARPLRIKYERAWYHVMNRGAAKKPIFHNAEQRQIFLEVLYNAHLKFKIEIHAYCLMTNHYHLLVHTPLANLSEAMRYINSIYAQQFNKLNDIDGPLFRGRFKSLLVDSDEYLLHLSRYIHLNPVSAKICEHVSDYPWSSFHHYMNENGTSWINVSEILSRFNGNSRAQREQYKLFVENIQIESSMNFLGDIDELPVIGSKNFIEKIKNEIPIKINQEIPEQRRLLKLYIPEIEDVINVVSCFYQVSREAITVGQRGKFNKPRAVAIYLSILLCQKSYTKIAEELGVSRTAISSCLSKFNNSLLSNEQLKNEVESLFQNLCQPST